MNPGGRPISIGGRFARGETPGLETSTVGSLNAGENEDKPETSAFVEPAPPGDKKKRGSFKKKKKLQKAVSAESGSASVEEKNPEVRSRVSSMRKVRRSSSSLFGFRSKHKDTSPEKGKHKDTSPENNISKDEPLPGLPADRTSSLDRVKMRLSGGGSFKQRSHVVSPLVTRETPPKSLTLDPRTLSPALQRALPPPTTAPPRNIVPRKTAPAKPARVRLDSPRPRTHIESIYSEFGQMGIKDELSIDDAVEIESCYSLFGVCDEIESAYSDLTELTSPPVDLPTLTPEDFDPGELPTPTPPPEDLPTLTFEDFVPEDLPTLTPDDLPTLTPEDLSTPSSEPSCPTSTPSSLSVPSCSLSGCLSTCSSDTVLSDFSTYYPTDDEPLSVDDTDSDCMETESPILEKAPVVMETECVAMETATEDANWETNVGHVENAENGIFVPDLVESREVAIDDEMCEDSQGYPRQNSKRGSNPE